MPKGVISFRSWGKRFPRPSIITVKQSGKKRHITSREILPYDARIEKSVIYDTLPEGRDLGFVELDRFAIWQNVKNSVNASCLEHRCKHADAVAIGAGGLMIG